MASTKAKTVTPAQVVIKPPAGNQHVRMANKPWNVYLYALGSWQG
jgi:hypothetical protein